MDRETVDIYEARAGEWVAQRGPRHAPRVRAFAAKSRGPSVDLGCGPGWYTTELAPPAIGLDVTAAMLDLARERAEGAWLIRADLEALPFRHGSIRSAWAHNSYVHLPRSAVPMALAHLHHSLAVDSPAQLWFFGGDDEGRDLFEGDDFGGRFFSLWNLESLKHVVHGAGFAVDRIELDERHGDIAITATLTRLRTLPDFVAPGLRMLVCGLNPSVYSADRGIGFARPGNRFWPAALAAGLVTRDRAPWHALAGHGVGFTDVVKRATPGADELTADEYRTGWVRIEHLVAWLQPRVVAFVGLAAWRAVVDRAAVPGLQSSAIGGRPAYVLPSTSGRNAHSSLADLVDHLTAAAEIADHY